jgi:hypothetical protein
MVNILPEMQKLLETVKKIVQTETIHTTKYIQGG